MAELTAEFGYFPQGLDETYGPISIATLPNLTSSVANVDASGTIDKDWVYAPPQFRRDFLNDKTLSVASRFQNLWTAEDAHFEA